MAESKFLDSVFACFCGLFKPAMLDSNLLR